MNITDDAIDLINWNPKANFTKIKYDRFDLQGNLFWYLNPFVGASIYKHNFYVSKIYFLVN